MIAGLPYDTIAFLWIGALFGGVAAGGSGFAFGVAASAIWLHRIDPVHCALMVTGCGVLLHSTTIWPQRRHIEVAKLWPFLIGGLAGIPIGVRLLVFTDAAVLKAAIGIFLLAFGAYALLSPRLHTFSGGGRVADAFIGFLGGILAELAAIPACCRRSGRNCAAGPRPSPAPSINPTSSSSGHHFSGFWFASPFGSFGLFLINRRSAAAVAWNLIGSQLYGRLDERRFRQFLAVLLVDPASHWCCRDNPRQLDPREVEEISKTLYIRALKLLPPDIKRASTAWCAREPTATGRAVLGTMVENIAIAERTKNILCQDTGIPIYNVTIGRNVTFDGAAMKEAIRRGCARATREAPLRSSVVHPITRKNKQNSCGERVPIVNFDFSESATKRSRSR